MSGIVLRDVSPELHRAIRIGAALRGCSMSEFILAVLAMSPNVREAARLAEDVAPSQGQEGEGNVRSNRANGA